jgi:hypothetical protein
MPARVFLFTRLLIILVIWTSMAVNNYAIAQETVDTDYYRAVINMNGSLDILNKNTETAILKNSPRLYFDYGETNSTPTVITVPNGSFEIDDNNDNIPDGWVIDKPYIRLSSEQARSGNKSLKLNTTDTNTESANVYSPLFTAVQGTQYTISIDSYASSFTSGSVMVYIYCYKTPDGSGAGWINSSPLVVPTTCGSWFTTSVDWKPPSNVLSFKILIFMNSSTTATIYFDNVSLAKRDFLYGYNNDNIEHTLTVNGNTTIITAVDDTNPYVKVNHQYRLNTHSPHINYMVTMQYKQNVLISEERCDFVATSQNILVMTRDMQLGPHNAAQTDIYTPKVIRFDNGLSFLGQDTMESMYLTFSGVNSLIRFYSDFGLNHPHYYFTKDSNNVIYTNETQRTAGDTYSASVTFTVDTTESWPYLVKTRQPYGYDAILTLSNHSDNETLDRLKAVAYGTTNESDPNYGKKGIAGRGIGWTKAVFVSDASPYASLADANFKTLTDKLYRDGVEIIGHSITPATDSRTVVASGLATLSQYNARNWIDHGASGGMGNWEDLASQGAIKDSGNYILDLLDQYNYQYAWSYLDVYTNNNALNMLTPDSTTSIRPFLFYNNNIDDNIHDNKKLYLWSTINTRKQPETFYTSDRVDNLIRERGVHIGHEYLAYESLENHAWYNDNGTLKICPTFDSELEYIAQKKAAGLLWSPTVVDLGDYLVSLKDVLVNYNNDGSVTVTNNNTAAITGITLLAENNIQSVKIGDYDLVSFGGSYGEKELVLPTIASGNSVTLNISFGTKGPFIPTIVSNDTGKNKINEITGYWDEPNKTLIMTAVGHGYNYSFTVTIPSRTNRTMIVKDITTNSTIGRYVSSHSGAIIFTAPLDSLHTFQIINEDFSSVDDFNSYMNTSELKNVWHSYFADIHLNSDPNYSHGNNSMELRYQSSCWIEANTVEEPCLPSLIGNNWALGDFKILALDFYGQLLNPILPMYVTLNDENNNNGTVFYGDNGEDQNNLHVVGWHEWDINLGDFHNAGVDLTRIKSIILGFGAGNGIGTLYFENIRLSPPKCILSKRSAYFARIDFAPTDSICGDCVVDYQELTVMANEWLMTPPSYANADLNSDGVINFRDFCILANMWLKNQLWPY